MKKKRQSNLNVSFKVGYTYLENIILDKFNTIDIPKLGKIKLKGLTINGDQDNVLIHVKCGGDFKGQIFVKGLIHLDEENQIISCDVQDLDVKSDALLYAIGIRIFKSLLIKKVEEISVIKVSDLEAMLLTAIEENTRKLEDIDLFITAHPVHLQVHNLKTRQDHVKLALELQSTVNVRLGNFEKIDA